MKNCRYCLGEKPLELLENLFGDEQVILEIDIARTGRLSAEYSAYSNDSSFDGYANINYCPMCGKILNTVTKLKEKILHKRIIAKDSESLTLEDGSELSFQCTEAECCAGAMGTWKTATLDAVITDVQLKELSRGWDDNADTRKTVAELTIYHNQNPIALAELEADAGHGGDYYSLLSVMIDEDCIGDIIST